jgi:hypothetical protein
MNIDILMKHFNAKYSNVQLQYSTPTEYLTAVHDADIEWPTKYDDMFPYADNADGFWTGYFTSRAHLKGFVRRGSKELNAIYKLASVECLKSNADEKKIQADLATALELFKKMGVLQHHDAVAGTAKQHVTDDYAYMLWKTIANTQQVYSRYINEYTFP